MQELEKFFEEKELEPVQWELQDNKGHTHIISNDVVIEHILQAPEAEQQGIYEHIVVLDFKDADINSYLKLLARALIDKRRVNNAN